MGKIGKKIKSIFSKKSKETPVYSTSKSGFAGAVPAGANEQTFRTTGRTEGGYTPAPSVSNQPTPKSRGGSRGSSSGGGSYQGAVPQSASEEVFRETGQTQGGISAVSKPTATRETFGQKFKRVFTPAGETKERFRQEALSNIAKREGNKLTQTQSYNYYTPNVAQGYTELPFTSKFEGQKSYIFTPTASQLQEAKLSSEQQYSNLPRRDRMRGYYSDFTFGLGREASRTAKQIAFGIRFPLIGYGGLIREEGSKDPILSTPFDTVKTGNFGTAGGVVGSLIVGGLATTKPYTTYTTSTSLTKGNTALTTTIIKTPRTFSPLEGFYKTEVSVTASKFKFKGGRYEVTSKSLTNQGISTAKEFGKINVNKLTTAKNKLINIETPIIENKGFAFSTGGKGTTAFKTSGKTLITPEGFSVSSSTSNRISKINKGFFVEESKPIISRSANVPYKKTAGIPEYTSGIPQYTNKQIQQSFIESYKPAIVTTPTKSTTTFAPSLQITQTKSTTTFAPSLQITQTKSTTTFAPTVKVQEFKQPKQKQTNTFPVVNLANTQKESNKAILDFTGSRTKTANRFGSRSITTFTPITSTTTDSVNSQKTVNKIINKPINNITPTIFTPTITTSSGFFFKPPKLSLDFGQGRYRSIGFGSQKKGYTPSFSALLFNIRGKKKRGVETGFNFRPILSRFTKRKKKK